MSPQIDPIDVQPEEKPWLPDLFPKQFEVFNNQKRITLVSGPRKTGKSIAICHRILKHLWDTPNALVALFTTSYKVATDGGSWTDLIKFTVPAWVGLQCDDPENGFLEYTTFIRGDEEGGPKLDAKSRTPFFRIRNRFGGESECRLFSIDNENEIDAKTMGLRFSGVWVIELSTFKTKKILDRTLLNLRAQGVRYEDHFWIADTNPPEEGKTHWAWKKWYVDRVDPDFVRQSEHPEETALYQKSLELIEIFLDDNTKLDPRERIELHETYRDNKDEFDRFVLGIWPEGSSMRRELFADILTSLHFPEGPIDVERNSLCLHTGWDMGSVNHAFVIIERRIIDGVVYWCALEEVVRTNAEISIADFTVLCLDKMIAINEFYKGRWNNFPGFEWEHWSDNSATAYHRPQIGSVDAAEVYRVSQGQIVLRGVEKPANSVEEDCKMIRTIIREGRFFIGGNCPQLKHALQNIKRGSRYAINPDDPLKHVVDALRYGIRNAWIEDLRLKQEQENNRRLIHVPLH